MFNRYDNLMAKAKKCRNKIERKTTKADVLTNKLRTKINEIKYKKNVYCENVNRKLKDYNSLISNERDRIERDKLEYSED